MAASIHCMPAIAFVLLLLIPLTTGQKKSTTPATKLTPTAKGNLTKAESIEQNVMAQLGLPSLPAWKPTPVPDPKQQSVPENSSRFRRGMFDCPCSPSNRSDGSLPAKDLAAMRDAINKTVGIAAFMNSSASSQPPTALLGKVMENIGDVRKAVKSATKALTRCRKIIKMEGCVNADAKLRGKAVPAMCSYDKTTGRNVFEGKTVGSCAGDGRFNQSRAQIQAAKLLALATKRRNRNEGCVAVEHVEGYALQHSNHLMRPVLCYRGFCATPNHAIIVDDRYTSMSRECAGDWTCTERETLVNNLKVASNRRARVDEHIVITPYDIRFPKAAVWLVQMLEDVWGILAMSVCSGTVAGAALLLYANSDIKA